MTTREQRSRLVLPPAVDRRTFIGGSDAPAIVGLSPWRTPYDVWRSKTEPQAEDLHPIERQRVLDRGKRLEPYIVDMLQDEHGVEVVARNRYAVDPEHDFLRAEVDFEYHDRETGSVENGEIKTVHPFRAWEWGSEDSDEIPAHYTVQSMHGLMVTHRRRTLFGVLIGDELRLYKVDADPEVIVPLRARELEFWRRVQTLDPPPPQTSDDVRQMFERDAGTSIEADADALEAYLELRSLERGIKELETSAERRREQLKLYLREHARLTVDGRDVVTWKHQESRVLDQARLKAERPELVEPFYTTRASRVFRLKGKQ